MIDKEQIVGILKKYGYYSLNRAPFLYQEEEKIGIYFVWTHKHYGNLERVLFFESLEKAEEEVFKYWWFQNYKEKYPISVEFDNYKTKTPHVSYTYKGTELTIDTMKNFEKENITKLEPTDTLKKRQLLRTATILILVLKEKVRVQNETYLKVIEMTETLNQMRKEYLNKLVLYKKGTKEEDSPLELVKENQKEGEQLLIKLNKELTTLDTVETIRNFINTLFQYLTNIESSVSVIQNNYLLNRYPFEIDDLRKKIEILDDALNERKKLFQNKQDPFSLINAVDNFSQVKKMVDVKVFIAKEQKTIQEKYQNRESIDENVLGDYIVSFEKLNITLPPMIQNNYYEEFDKNDLFVTLKNTFEELTEKEKSACFVASSFLRECLIVLMEKNADTALNINEVISHIILDKKIHLFNDAYTTLDDFVNVKIRVKYFSILKMKSFESFMLSLIEVIQILKNLKQTLNKSFYAYYVEKEKLIINLYLKNIVHLNKKTSYIARFMPNVPIYFSPVSITRQLDFMNNNELIERDTDTIFLLKDMVSIKTSDEKTEVVKYEKDKVSKDKYTIVHSLKEKNRCTYYENMIYSREDGNLYE